MQHVFKVRAGPGKDTGKNAGPTTIVHQGKNASWTETKNR